LKGERLSEEMERRHPALWQFFGCYLHQDWPIFHGTPDDAVDTAVAESSLDRRRAARRDLAALLAEIDDDTRLRKVLNDGFGVELSFRKAADARRFAERAEQKLSASIRTEFDQNRKEHRR